MWGRSEGLRRGLKAAVALANGQGAKNLGLSFFQQQSQGLRTCAAVHSSGVSSDVLDAVKKGSFDFKTHFEKEHNEALAKASSGESSPGSDEFLARLMASDKDAEASMKALKEEHAAIAPKMKVKDWWAETQNKFEYWDNPDAHALVDYHFKKLEAVAVTPEARAEVSKFKRDLLDQVDSYRQLFKEMKKNPYLTNEAEVDWSKLRKDFPSAKMTELFDFFQAQEKLLSADMEAERKAVVNDLDAIVFKEPLWVYNEEKLKWLKSSKLPAVKKQLKQDMAQAAEDLADNEVERDNLLELTVYDCLENDPKLAAEIDAQIERQEW